MASQQQQPADLTIVAASTAVINSEEAKSTTILASSSAAPFSDAAAGAPPSSNNAAASTALFYHEDMAKHAHDWNTIEKHTRATDAYNHLQSCGLLQQVQEIRGRKATAAELETVHSRRHIDEVERLTQAAREHPTDRKLREPDGPGGVYFSAEADNAARLACGCVIDAAHHVSQTTATDDNGSSSGARRRTAFALVRPPGHHAGFDDTPGHRAEGFCFYNSVAVAAGCLLASGHARRVAIVDWDVHHGNGTQRLFYNDSRVLYISLHRYGAGWYPESGAIDESGEGDGVGFNVNIPWPANDIGDTDYLAAFHTIVVPILQGFAADALLVSAGFDAAEGDAQGRMRVTPSGFAAMMRVLLEGTSCPVAAALEGGYNSVVTSQCCEAVIRVLLGEEVAPPPTQRLSKHCQPTLRQVLDVQRPHWPVLRGSMMDGYFARAATQQVAPARLSKRSRAS